MSRTGPVYLGVDLGTSALKIVAVACDGTILASARRDYPTARPQPGAAEQDPRHWWAALDDAVGDVARMVEPSSWSAVALSAMLPTLVELDEHGRPEGPAITWEDARAEPEAERLRSAVGVDTLYRVTGQRVDGRYLAPMHARLHRLSRAGAAVAGAKDVLFAYLTGELLTDPSTAAGTGVYDLDGNRWDSGLVAAAGLPRLPDIATAATALPLCTELQERWGLPGRLPVVLGAADSVLGAAAVGAVSHGDVAVVAGTSAVVLGVADTAVRDPDRRYLVTPLTGNGWGLEMDLLAMGSAFAGIAHLLGLPGPSDLLDSAQTVPVDDAPTFLPYLTPGEQGALWDPDLTGTLHGLHLGMRSGHIGRALLTGVVVELRRCIAVLTSATGRSGPILLGGNAAASPLLWQDLADATGREVRVDPSTRDHSALGAALFAAAASGTEITRTGATFTVTPRPDRRAWWNGAAERHDALRAALGPVKP